MITFKHTGDFRKTKRYLKRLSELDILTILNRFGNEGVRELSDNTPIDTGITSLSWNYTIEKTGTGYKLCWNNTSIDNNIPVIILLVYGHGTAGGTYVQGRDLINPVMKPIFDKISSNIWKEVTSI